MILYELMFFKTWIIFLRLSTKFKESFIYKSYGNSYNDNTGIINFQCVFFAKDSYINAFEQSKIIKHVAGTLEKYFPWCW